MLVVKQKCKKCHSHKKEKEVGCPTRQADILAVKYKCYSEFLCGQDKKQQWALSPFLWLENSTGCVEKGHFLRDAEFFFTW